MIVLKFGGSSLASAEKIHRCIELMQKELDRHPMLVLSACGKTTDMLIAAAQAALEGKVDTAEVESYTRSLIVDLKLENTVVDDLLEQFKTLLNGISLLRELTARTMDHIMSFGERISTRLVAATLCDMGIPAQACNAFDLGLVTDSKHGSAMPVGGIDEQIAASVARVEGVPVVTGFLGKDQNGNITTLGRSGSDFSAAIMGAAVRAEEVQIWTDVDGVMTCDPSLDRGAKSLSVLSFEEASELAYYGAKVLHANTLIPAIHNGIPVRVLNTMNPTDPGTRIIDRAERTDRVAKSVVYKENVCLINLSSPRLMSAVKMLSLAFQELTQNDISVHMATTSEASVSLVTDRHYNEAQFEQALVGLAKLGPVEVERNKAIICVIGEELKGRVGVLSQVFGAVAKRGIKAKMVSQSASEINVAFLVDNEQIEPAVKALHDLLLESAQ